MASWGGVVPNSKRIGICLHYDASTSDAGGIEWLKSPKCKLSYNFAVRDNGEVVEIAPENRRAYHAGVCKPSSDFAAKANYTDANSSFYGIAITATSGDVATEPQKQAVVALCKRLYAKHGWTEPWRITGHSAEAWPRGRKADPEGQGAKPVLDIAEIRRYVVGG